MLVSLVAVALNCYPIIFCGRSYVSPTCVNGTLVYTEWPPLPGMTPGPAPDVLQHGSDTAAMMWWGVPVGFIESRSLLEQGVLPLWDRYGHAGETLIGQAVSMLGDPLQLIVILGHGSAVAWDLKFLAAKFFFCVGFGLLILRRLENRTLSLIYSALAAYCGAWFYISNHPVFFVFSYAPWILLAALEWLDLQSGRQVRWGLVWLLANFACFNAGHVEVAVVLIGGLNLSALAAALIRHHGPADVISLVNRMGGGTLIFLGLTMPAWMSFWVSLDGAFTVHPDVNVVQLPPTTLPGVFDDVFYQLLRLDKFVAAFAPGTSLLILVGCSFTVLGWRQLKGEPFFWANLGALVLWGACVFKGIPASFLAAIPFLNHVGHVCTDFSFLLVIHLMIQSAYGFKCLAKVETFRQLAGDLACLAGVFAGLIVLYSFRHQRQPIPWNYFLGAGLGAVGAPLLFACLKIRRRRILAPGWVAILVLGFIPNFRFGLYHAGNDTLLMLPGPRVVLNTPSPALERIKLDATGPFRVVGLQWNFMGNYSAVYGLEDIRSCAPLSNREFMELLGSFPGVNLSRGWMVEVADPVRAQPLLNLLNVKYLLAPPEFHLEGKPGFQLADRSDFRVWENLQVWPRAFFSDQVVSLSATETFIQALLHHGQQPFIALTREAIDKRPGVQQLETTNQAIVSPATNYRLFPNSTEFDIHAPSAGMVCLTEGQARDFTARANGESREVLTVNCAFKGIYLDKPGDYHVQFIYRPRHWRLACAGFWISAGVAIGLAGLSFIRVKELAKGRNKLND